MQKIIVSHFDFYRVKNISEVYNIGVYEYLNNSNFVLSDRKLLMKFYDKYLKIFIKVNNSKRIINIV